MGRWRVPCQLERLLVRNAGRLPGHELEPRGPLRPDGGEAPRHRAILATRGDLVHRGAGDDRDAAVGARPDVPVRGHLAILAAPRLHGVTVLRPVVARRAAGIVRW